MPEQIPNGPGPEPREELTGGFVGKPTARAPRVIVWKHARWEQDGRQVDGLEILEVEHG